MSKEVERTEGELIPEGNAGGKTPIVKKVTKEWKWFNYIVVGLVTAAITAMVFLIFAS